MNVIRNHKKFVIIGAVVGVLALASAAFAFYLQTAGGPGTATGTVSAPTADAITLTGVIAGGLSPTASKTVTFTANNPAPSPAAILSTIHLDSVTIDAGHSGCDPLWFSMANVVANQTLPAGTMSVPITQTGTVVMANPATNQNACGGATLTLNVTAS